MKKVTAVIKPHKLDDVKEALSAFGVTGRIGDGKVWITAVDRVIRIRTGETDAEAL